MPPAPYPDFRWFFRTVRVLPVVAVAALAGGIIGGFSVFAINLALTAPPNHNIPAEPGSKLATEAANDNAAASPAPMRTLDAATPVVATAPPAAPAAPTSATPVASTSNLPAVSEPAPVSANNVSLMLPAAAAMTATQSAATDAVITVVHPQTIQTTIAAAPPARNAWPDALSREHSVAPSDTTARAPETVPVQTAQQPETKAQTMKRRVAIKHTRALDARADETNSGDTRPLYDDYSRQDEYGRQGYSRDSRPDDADRADRRTAKPRYTARRRSVVTDRSSERVDGRLYDRSDDRGDDDDGEALQVQPPPPPPPLFFGLFGGDN